MSAIVVRIKFPNTYPLIYKTLRIDATMTVDQAVQFIKDSLHIPNDANIGLFVPDWNRVLDGEAVLTQYEELQEVEYVEYKILDDSLPGVNRCSII